MTRDEIIATQVRVGTKPDGAWGSDSIRRCQSHLRALNPSPNPWPASDQSSLKAFYGSPGNESNLINLPIPSGVIVKFEGKQVKTIRCHHKVGNSLSRILVQLSTVSPSTLLRYEGCYYDRPIRGGSTPSLHAYGAAIDFDASNNGNHDNWPYRATMPISVMEVFASEGWLPAGAFWHRDAMHFQATR